MPECESSLGSCTELARRAKSLLVELEKESSQNSEAASLSIMALDKQVDLIEEASAVVQHQQAVIDNVPRAMTSLLEEILLDDSFLQRVLTLPSEERALLSTKLVQNLSATVPAPGSGAL